MNACAHCAAPISRGTLCLDCTRQHIESMADQYRADVPVDDMDLPDPDEGTQGKRGDQVEFSSAVFIACALIGFLVVGISIGCAIATATTPMH